MEYFTDEIEKSSLKYGCDPSIVKAIIMQESAWNIYAVRAENSYRWFFNPELYASNNPWINISTEICTQKMSWGLGQIMGALAREQGHNGLMAEILEPYLNIKHICIRIKTLMKTCKSPEEIFACYNGGLGMLKTVSGKFKNEGYVVSAMGHLIKYQNA